MKFDFYRHILENKQMKNLMKIRLMGTQLFRADGWTDRQTDMKKLIAGFCNFAKEA
jgi:hypothetical protein